jgi:hypothetical protein
MELLISTQTLQQANKLILDSVSQLDYRISATYCNNIKLFDMDSIQDVT